MRVAVATRLLFLAACAAPLPAARGESAHQIPYRLTPSGHVLVRARIGGRGPFNFVLDTGAPYVTVNRTLAETLKLRAGVDGWAQLPAFEVEGGLAVPNPRARVETPPQLQDMNALGLAGVEWHGVLGTSLLARYRITLDLTRRHMTWADPGGEPALQRDGLRGVAGLPRQAATAVIPIEVLASQHLAVAARVNGHGPYRLLVDTGSPVNVLSPRLGREANLGPPGPEPRNGRGGSATVVTVRALQVGKVTAADVPALVMDHPTLAPIARTAGPVDGILGLPFFGRYRMTLDCRAGTLALTPTGHKPPDALAATAAALKGAASGHPPSPPLAPANPWGLQAARAGGDDRPGVTVRAVTAGSPADAAGLRAGDRVLTADGRWTDSPADLDQAAALVPPGTAAPVRVRRGGREITLTVTPGAGAVSCP